MGLSEISRESIEIPSIPDYVAKVDDFLESWLRKQNVPADIVADLAIAVTELVNNAIKHGNGSDRGKKVRVALIHRDGEIEAIVSDQGSGFKPDNIPSPIAKENLMKEIGRGIFIVRSLMDSVRFEFPGEGGTRVIISKRIA